MKFSLVTTLAVLGSASAFVQPIESRASLVHRSVLAEPTVEAKDGAKETPAVKEIVKSESIATGMPELSIKQESNLVLASPKTETKTNAQIEP